jgi:hypothetical protein
MPGNNASIKAFLKRVPTVDHIFTSGSSNLPLTGTIVAICSSSGFSNICPTTPATASHIVSRKLRSSSSHENISMSCIKGFTYPLNAPSSALNSVYKPNVPFCTSKFP